MVVVVVNGGGKQGYIHPKAKNPHSLLKVREKLTKKEKKKKKGKIKKRVVLYCGPCGMGVGEHCCVCSAIRALE